MKAIEIYGRIKERGYDAGICSAFSYNIDRDRRFWEIHVKGEIDKGLVSLVDEAGCMLVAVTVVNVDGDEPEYRVDHVVYPRDMRSFDWIEE